jgi:SagB-type dehydrogenase family enzyme
LRPVIAKGNTSSALRYHDATKHSELSLRMSGHYLDWDNKPSPFKAYKNLTSKPLPHDFPFPREESLKAVKSQASSDAAESVNLQNLTEILFFSGGLTRKMKIGGETHYMRAASATGALYPIEFYIVTPGIPGLDPGVYHFNPLDFSLVQLREGDYSSELANATGGATAYSPLTIALTSLAWRNSWKYEARSYRHWFWDAGVIAANLLATCSSEPIAARLLLGYVDTEIDRLLGLRQQEEATVALATLGEGFNMKANTARREIPQLDPDTEPSSIGEVDYPIIWETNHASALNGQEDVRAWRRNLKAHQIKASPIGPMFPLQPSTRDSPSLADAILRRGSARRFAQLPIPFKELSTIIDVSTGPIPLDFVPDNESLTEFYLVANAVEGLASGSYHFDRETKSLGQLKEGKLRYVSGYLCLEQLLFSDASVVFFLMADLGRIIRDLGDRGYRAAQFEAGVRAGKIYLSSYSQGIGASGSTFYDDAVTEFFSPHAQDLSTMIAVGVGLPAYKARPGRILPQFQGSRRSST